MRNLLTIALTGNLIKDLQPLPSSLWPKLRDIVEDSSDTDVLLKKAGELPDVTILDSITPYIEALHLVEIELKEFQSRGIELLTEFDEYYPEIWRKRLKNHPPCIFVSGDQQLLNTRSIGLVGSRDVDDIGRSFACAVAEEAVKNEYTVVSGGARGVDQFSMQAAIEAGGRTIGFLADSLWKTVESADVRLQFESGNLCLATPYSPRAGFQVWSAMQRNKLIYTHSEATVVVSSAKGSGGTWAGAIEALKHKWCPVLIRLGPEVPEGNDELIKRGGIPLKSPKTLLKKMQPVAVQGTLF